MISNVNFMSTKQPNVFSRHNIKAGARNMRSQSNKLPMLYVTVTNAH